MQSAKTAKDISPMRSDRDKMPDGNQVLIEFDKEGVTFKQTGVGLFSDEPMEIGSKEWDNNPINGILINGGRAQINAQFDDDESGRPTVIQLVVDSVERRRENAASTGTRDFWDRLEKVTGIQYDDETGEIMFVDQRSDKENYTSFVKFIFDEGYMEKEDLPYQTPNARKHWLLNTQPVHKDGSDMDRPGEPVDGVYTETYHSKENKKKNMLLLVEEFVEGSE